MTLTEQAIATIAAGCEGVTEGPWTWGARWLCRRVAFTGNGVIDYQNLAQVPRGEYDSKRWGTDAAHIARLDPATVLALCALAQEALQSRREGQQMREALRTAGWLQDDEADRALSHPKPESVKS